MVAEFLRKLLRGAFGARRNRHGPRLVRHRRGEVPAEQDHRRGEEDDSENQFRFAVHGRISVTVSVLPCTPAGRRCDRNPRLCAEEADQQAFVGLGAAEEAVAQVFDRGVAVDPAEVRGAGVAEVDRTVVAVGGAVRAEHARIHDRGRVEAAAMLPPESTRPLSPKAMTFDGSLTELSFGCGIFGFEVPTPYPPSQ